MRDLCIDLYEKLNQDSSNSSKPPSSDDPFLKGKKQQKDDTDDAIVDEPCDESTDENDSDDSVKKQNKKDETDKRKPGKQKGAPGFGRIEKKKPDDTEEHYPHQCVVCQAKLEKPPFLQAHAGHRTYELERDENGIVIVCTLHRYHWIVCKCGHENKEFPGQGSISVLEGRKRNIQLSENRLVGPMLATLIASLNREFKMSRNKIRQFLMDWFGLEMSTGTICNCIREAGVACYPIVDDLIEQLQTEEKVHLDETPWYQKGVFLWLWVAISENIVVYFIGARKKEELVTVITEAFVGWLITDGYHAYRDHPNRQRCLAHLIRKAIALIGAVDAKAQKMGDWFLKEMRGLIKAVSQGEEVMKKCGPILARLKRACNLGSKSDHAKLNNMAGSYGGLYTKRS